jgi:hypothetical protein
MNRKSFLRLLGIGSIAAVVAPKLLIPKPEPAIKCDTGGLWEYIRMQNKLMDELKTKHQDN